MTVPAVLSVSTNPAAAAQSLIVGATYSITLPATINAGDRMLIITATDTTSDALSTPTGWTAFTIGAGSLSQFFGWYRDCDGSEGGTTINSTNSGATANVASAIYRLQTGTFDATKAPQVSTTAIATSTTPDPPSLAPSWGSRDALWIAFESISNRAKIGDPAGYTTGGSNGTGSGQRAIGHAYKTSTAASEDPGTFTLTGSGSWSAFTVGVAGTAAAASSGNFFEMF